MKKKEKFNKKNLRDRLAAILTIYLDGLGNKKRKKMDKYLDSKLSGIVDYYVALLDKKKKKTRVLPPLPADLSGLTAGMQETDGELVKEETIANDLTVVEIIPADEKELEGQSEEFEATLNEATAINAEGRLEAEESAAKYQ